MKRTFKAIFLSLMVAVGLASCINNDPVTFNGAKVEMDAASWNANSPGVNYPILTRRPAEGRAVSSSTDPTLTRTSGTVRLRVNLVGAQRSTATTVSYTTSGTAVAGTHYTALPGTVTIPANSSYGFIDVPILDPGAGTGTVDLIITLTGTTEVQPSENYKSVGLRISQA